LSLTNINKLLAAQIEQKNVPLDCFAKTTTSKIVKKKDKEGNEARYLIEIHLPKAVLNYQGKEISREMTYSDIRHLILTRFRYWKEFLIRCYFRVELNVTDPIPHKVNNAK